MPTPCEEGREGSAGETVGLCLERGSGSRNQTANVPPLTGHPQPVLSEPQLRPCRLPRGPEGQGHAPPVPGFPRSRHKDQEVSATRIGPSRVAGAGPGAKQLLQSEATLSFATRGFISACRAEVGGSFSVGRFSSNRGSLFLSFFKAISFLQLI